MNRAFLWLAALALVVGAALLILNTPDVRLGEPGAAPEPTLESRGGPEARRLEPPTGHPPAPERRTGEPDPGPVARADQTAFAATMLEVRVVAEPDGLPVQGLAVHLIGSTSVPGVGHTDEFGFVAFPGLAPGAHSILLGDGRYPLVPAVAVEVAQLGTRRETLTVPTLAQIGIRVVDAQGKSVPLAIVEGFGLDGGHFEAEADLQGRYHATHILPGLTRVFARHPDLGRGDQAVQAVPGEVREVLVRLRH